jgi:hypothetical protein
LSTAETPGRIRWEPVTSTTIAVETGHVGLLPSHSFVIYSPEAGRTGLTVTSQLPGQQHHRYISDRIGELKAVAEEWLEEYIASLGASFDTGIADAARYFAETWAELLPGLPDSYSCEMTCSEAEAAADLYRALGDDTTAAAIITAHAEHDTEEDAHWGGRHQPIGKQA